MNNELSTLIQQQLLQTNDKAIWLIEENSQSLQLEKFAQTQGLPVTVSLRCQALMDNAHPNYVGHFSVGPTPYLKTALAAFQIPASDFRQPFLDKSLE